MDRVGAPTGIIVGEIRLASDLTTVVTSVEAQQDISTLGTNASVNFDFPPVRLQSGVEYAMYVYVLGGVQDASNRLMMHHQVSGGYAAGQYLLGSGAGARTGSWSAYDTSFRLLGGTYP